MVIQKKHPVNGCFGINYIDILNIPIMIKLQKKDNEIQILQGQLNESLNLCEKLNSEKKNIFCEKKLHKKYLMI